MSTESAKETNNFRLHHVLGTRATPVGLCALNDERIAYSSASCVVIQNVTTRSQHFIESDDDYGKITAMAVDHSRNLIGVAEKKVASNAVTIYDSDTLECKCTLVQENINSSDTKGMGAHRDGQNSSSGDIIFISFSKCSTKCLVLGGPPSYTLTMWDMDRSAAPFASIKLCNITKKEIISAAVCPTNDNLVSIVGKKIMRLFHVSNKNGKFLPVKNNLKTESQNFSAQVWLASSSGELILGADSGSLTVMGADSKEAKQSLKVEHGPISSLAACPIGGGFVVGCRRGGLILLYQRSHKKDIYSLRSTIHLYDKPGIVALLVMKIQGGSNTMCDAICLTENRSIIKTPLIYSNDDYEDDKFFGETELVPSLNRSLRSIDSLIPHSGSLFVDCCTWKPLVAIGGYDGVVRLFDYDTKQVVLTHRLDDSICNLSFHPSGNYLLVSTPKAVRLYSVLTDKLTVYWQVEDLPQIARVCFSRGGDLFAIAIGATVQVYDLFLKENVSTLRGHSKPVIDLSFPGHKDELITASVDGVVCLWDINRGVTKTRTVDSTSPAYLAGCISQNQVYVISSDCLLKRVGADSGKIEIQSTYDASTVKVMTPLPHGKIIVCLDGGNIECVSDDLLVRQHCFRQQNVTSVRCSKDSSSQLIAADKEGFVNFYHCTSENTPQSLGYLPYVGISNVSKAGYEEKLSEIKSLEDSIQALQSKHMSTLDSLNSNHGAIKVKLDDELQLKKNAVQLEVNELAEDVQSLKTKHEFDMKTLGDRHEITLQSAREDCEKKLAMEERNTKQFIKRYEEKRCEFEAQMVELANGHTAAVDRETRILHERIVCENEKNDYLVKTIKDIKKHTSECEKRMEEDADREIVQLSVTYQKELKLLKRSNALLSNEKGILQQRHGACYLDLKELRDQVDSQEDKLRMSEETVKSLNSVIEAGRAVIIEQGKTILNQERDICCYSQANLEEEHHNSDLVDARMKLETSLSAEESMVKLKEIEMEHKKAELKGVRNDGETTRLEMNRLTLKLQQTRANRRKLETKKEEKKKLLVDLETEIAKAINHIDNHKSLKASLCSLSEQFLRCTSKQKTQGSGPNSNAEKLLALDKKICTLRKSMERKKKIHTNEMQRLRREKCVLEEELIQDPKKQGKKKDAAAKTKSCHVPLSDSKLINKG